MMIWGTIDILLLGFALVAQMVMVRFVCIKEGDRRIYPVFMLYNIYRIFEYAEITRRERGRVGCWFWCFLLSFMLLCLALAVEML